MHITFVISSLTPGGAENTLILLANGLAKKERQVTVVTFDDTVRSTAPYLLPQITHVPLNQSRASSGLVQALTDNLTRVTTLRKTIKSLQPDAVVSFMDTTNILTLLAVGRLAPVIISERVHPAYNNIGRIWPLLRKATYGLAAAIVIQTKDISQYFSPRISQKCTVISNPVPPPPTTPPTHTLRSPSVVAMGRLTTQKGFDLLLDAFAKIRHNYPQWTLTIFGEGPDRSSLEEQRDSLGLHDHVSFLGWTKTPHADIAQADLFVMPSRFEGFPNALCDAMACGLPVIATDCPSGPAEIIRHNKDGMIVPVEDVNALASTMEEFFKNQGLREAFGDAAKEIVERYNEQNIIEQWNTLIKNSIDSSTTYKDTK